MYAILDKINSPADLKGLGMEELRQLCADLPVIEFHRSERRLEEAFVDILLNKNKKPDSASGQTVSPSSSAQWPFH